ncbi:hypothetical protein FKG94_27755 [Exilibacterium tricleocarpae]|uniref:Type II secretion system protein GspB C-terminal domain-containing protein n=1 Tax=Exilibacterium tricleocarpae TaxID=2591008 RepID=A0A545SM10_9GAMM|nr:general secretion pathway protein GspB [Exilibacterium tricleocarpae]TQV65991.1 hypothetical protein FKG94_27755 [Exilibacterium tricleocarpae]
MSYILDALNKSEQERRQQLDAPSLQLAPTGNDARSGANWLLLIPSLVVLVAIVAFAGYRLLPGVDIPAPEATAAPAQRALQPDTANPPARHRGAATTADTTAATGSMATGADTLASRAASAPPIPAGGADNAANAADIPYLADLPWSFRGQVPDIDYSAHVYSENGGTGFVILNGSMRYEGNNVGGGLTVREILPAGVVLEYRGRQFRLDAMKSWRQR